MKSRDEQILFLMHFADGRELPSLRFCYEHVTQLTTSNIESGDVKVGKI